MIVYLIYCVSLQQFWQRHIFSIFSLLYGYALYILLFRLKRVIYQFCYFLFKPSFCVIRINIIVYLL